MKVKDFSVSQKDFDLVYNKEYQLYHTQPVPENLGNYYESEDYISHTDSKKSWFDSIYQIVKKWNLKNKIKLIQKYKKDNLILLDVGAGTGEFIKYAKKNNWRGSGIEPNEKARNIAKEKGLSVYENYNKLTETTFDVITYWHVLEHITDLKKEIQNINYHLKKDGILIIAVPNYKSWDAYHYQHYWAAYDVPRHIWHFSKFSIKKIFTENHFELIDTKPMLFDAFYVSMLSEKYKTGKRIS